MAKTKVISVANQKGGVGLCIVGNYGKLENRNLIYSAFLSPITLHN